MLLPQAKPTSIASEWISGEAIFLSVCRTGLFIVITAKYKKHFAALLKMINFAVPYLWRNDTARQTARHRKAGAGDRLKNRVVLQFENYVFLNPAQ